MSDGKTDIDITYFNSRPLYGQVVNYQDSTIMARSHQELELLSSRGRIDAKYSSSRPLEAILSPSAHSTHDSSTHTITCITSNVQGE